MELDRERLVRLYKMMVLIRAFENKIVEISKFTDDIWGVLMTCDGQEAVPVGICENLNSDDYVLGSHRPDGHLIARGGNLKKIMAELFGKATGYCRGRGGQMHYQAAEVGFITASGIVGDTIPIATGAGLSIKVRNTNQVVVCFFGDGAINTGAFHEAVNLAAVWHLPVVFVCENNFFAIDTRISDTAMVGNLAERAAGYGIPGIVVDGMDVLEVYRVGREAIAKARKGEGPVLIEAKTYRFVGHSALDPGDGIMYKDKKEDREWRDRCPIKMLGDRLERDTVLSVSEIKEIEKQAKAEVEEAAMFAAESAYPGVDEPLTAFE